MNLQDIIIQKLIENSRLEEATKNKILLYPSDEYRNRMDPEDITNLKGILFGGFNDEEIWCSETGFSNINEMEKAVKNKEYMIDIFENDEDFGVMEGTEWWKYIINTIKESYVDNDSYWSMFLLDSNGYKILYCGSEKPVIEDYKSQSSRIKLTIKTSKIGQPFFKNGSYKIYPDIVEDQLNMKDLQLWSIYDNNDDEYNIDQLEKAYNIENFVDLITSDLQNSFNTTYKKYITDIIQKADIKDEKSKQLFNRLVKDNILKSGRDIENIIDFLNLSGDRYNGLVNYYPYEFEREIIKQVQNSRFNIKYELDDVFGIYECSEEIINQVKSFASKMDSNTLFSIYKDIVTLKNYSYDTSSTKHFTTMPDYIYLISKFGLYPKDFLNVFKSANVKLVNSLGAIIGPIILAVYENKLNDKETILDRFKKDIIKYQITKK